MFCYCIYIHCYYDYLNYIVIKQIYFNKTDHFNFIFTILLVFVLICYLYYYYLNLQYYMYCYYYNKCVLYCE